MTESKRDNTFECFTSIVLHVFCRMTNYEQLRHVLNQSLVGMTQWNLTKTESGFKKLHSLAIMSHSLQD